jgi:hypothetical protein
MIVETFGPLVEARRRSAKHWLTVFAILNFRRPHARYRRQFCEQQEDQNARRILHSNHAHTELIS